MLGAYSDIAYYDTIVKYHDAATWCAFFTNVRILIKITSSSQTAQVGSNHFSGRVSKPLLFDQKLNVRPCTNGIFYVGSNNSTFIPAT